VLGKELLLNAEPCRIVGVMPAGFAFPHGSESFETAGHRQSHRRLGALGLIAEAESARDDGRVTPSDF
jgi:hypothetical protein